MTCFNCVTAACRKIFFFFFFVCWGLLSLGALQSWQSEGEVYNVQYTLALSEFSLYSRFSTVPTALQGKQTITTFNEVGFLSWRLHYNEGLIFFPACAYVTYFRNKNRKAGTLATWNAESIYSSLFFVKKVIAVLQQCSLRRYFSRVRYHMLIVTFSWPFYTWTNNLSVKLCLC